MNSTLRTATITAFVTFSTSRAFALPNPTDVFPAQSGPIKITPIYHASLQIEYQGEVIQVDPFSAGDYTGAKKANLILITHSHPDHYDPKAITAVADKRWLSIVAPPSMTDQIGSSIGFGRQYQVNVFGLKNGQSEQFGKTKDQLIRVEAVPAYNIKRGPKPGQKFHPKGEFNGYILTLGGKRIYIAGDTEVTPEMKALKHIDIAFVPMNLPYTMTPREAAQGVRAFKPKVVYPYHYRFPFNKPNDNPQQFQKALAGSGIDVRIRGWYAHTAAK